MIVYRFLYASIVVSILTIVVTNAANVKNAKFNMVVEAPPSTVKPSSPPPKKVCNAGVVRTVLNGDLTKNNCSDFEEVEVRRSEINELDRWKTQMVIACTVIAAFEIFVVVIIVLYWKQIRWSLRKIQCPCEKEARRERRERQERRRRQRDEQRRLRRLLITSTQHALRVTQQPEPAVCSYPQIHNQDNQPAKCVPPQKDTCYKALASSGAGGVQKQEAACQCCVLRENVATLEASIEFVAPKDGKTVVSRGAIPNHHCHSTVEASSKSSPTKSKASRNSLHVPTQQNTDTLSSSSSSPKCQHHDHISNAYLFDQNGEPIPSTSRGHTDAGRSWAPGLGRGGAFARHLVLSTDSESDCDSDTLMALTTVQVHR